MKHTTPMSRATHYLTERTGRDRMQPVVKTRGAEPFWQKMSRGKEEERQMLPSCWWMSTGETSFFHSLKNQTNNTWFIHLIAYCKSHRTVSSCLQSKAGAKHNHLVCLSKPSPLNLVRPSSNSLIRFILQLPTSCDVSLPSSCFIFRKLSLLLSSK